MRRAAAWMAVAACLGAAAGARAQESASDGTVAPAVSLRALPGNVLRDQREFWTMPTKFRARDSQWMLPLGSALAIAIASDTAVDHRAAQGGTQGRPNQMAKGGLAALAGAAGGLVLLGQARHDAHMRETGWLAVEAAVDALAVTTAVQAVAGRQGPGEGDGRGRFGAGGGSFPSQHAALAWSLASVLAHRYPGRMTRTLAYGTAAAVSAARVKGRQHFAADVIAGGAIGWYMGRQVARSRGSDRDPDTARWGRFVRAEDGDGGATGSPYVPLDGWEYAAFDRLAALGAVQTGMAGQRPWTRRECARLVEEAGERLEGGEESEAAQLYRALRAELAAEAGEQASGVEIEAVYARAAKISGPPLRDGYHFAQTVVNDYGRPYGEGWNAVTGVTARAASGPFAAYVRAEYERAPGIAPWTSDVRAAIAAADFTPAAALPPGAPASQFRLLEGYVALQWRQATISFGKEALWWGPGRGGPLLLGSNAGAIPMLRVDQSEPAKLPSILGRLGPMRTQFFLGRVGGQQFVATPPGTVGEAGRALARQPYLHGQKVSFRPTPNLEFAFSRTVMFGGPGFPVTLRSFWESLVSRSTENNARDPGDRRSGFEFSYRMAGIRDWLTVYLDAYTDDEISPLALPAHAAWSPGIYLPKLPRLGRLELRAEGYLTPARTEYWPGFYYSNVRYRSGYTSDGMLLGNWIGRQGNGFAAWSTYWFSPRNKVEASYRQMQVDRSFLRGGRLQDFRLAGEWLARPRVAVSATVQYERWNFPLLAAGTRSNVLASVQVTYTPHWKVR